ncbi:colorectal cancer associated 2 [Polyodon spathula]|uniref:colorectal cancer associated 2 n=1 Tax=Polyodon spathula TaxID=7913 RepID=UPI001B7F1617|nr:colorectal cancer associated 2 [Polyodon spathula]
MCFLEISQSTDSVQLPSHTSFAAPYYTASANTAETSCFQPGLFTDNFSYEQMMCNALENQQIVDMLLQPDNCTSSALYPNPISQHSSYGNYQPGAEHYNSAMAPSYLSDSSDVSSPVDYNNYSPPQCYSSASSSYGSPTHVDPRHCGSISEDCPSHHCSLPYDCCLSQAPSPQAHMNQLPEYIPYPSSNCLYPSAMTEESFIRREPNNWDMCYL